MAFQDLFKTKSLEMLHEEMKGENRLRRVLGPAAGEVLRPEQTAADPR